MMEMMSRLYSRVACILLDLAPARSEIMVHPVMTFRTDKILYMWVVQVKTEHCANLNISR